MHRVLFITYDGLLDPLGSSQILPYIKIINCHVSKMVILSFEKSHRTIEQTNCKKIDLNNSNIIWKPLSFTGKYGAWGKIYDLIRMYLFSTYLTATQGIKIIHARGHLSAEVGAFLKKIFKIKLIFDFRGLWVDERVDKGGWDINKYVDRIQYKYYKKKEAELLEIADAIIVLTEKMYTILAAMPKINLYNVTIIPCCADFHHFPLATSDKRKYARNKLRIPNEAMVLGYVGSVGNMYRLDRFFDFFIHAYRFNNNCIALIITENIEELEKIIYKKVPPNILCNLIYRSSNRNEMPELISSMSVLISFIEPSYARKAASPTKIAECLSEGVPVISNYGIGDVTEVINGLKAGVVLDLNSEDDFIKHSKNIVEISKMGGKKLRNRSVKKLSLNYAGEKYKYVYKKLLCQI